MGGKGRGWGGGGYRLPAVVDMLGLPMGLGEGAGGGWGDSAFPRFRARARGWRLAPPRADGALNSRMEWLSFLFMGEEVLPALRLLIVQATR